MILYSPANKTYFLKREFALNLTHFEARIVIISFVFSKPAKQLFPFLEAKYGRERKTHEGIGQKGAKK